MTLQENDPADTHASQISDTTEVLQLFSAPTRAWFEGAFEQPTHAQAGAWRAIDQDQHAVVVAPTGSGKTLAAFLWALDQIFQSPIDPDSATTRCKILYISPLKALAADVERNLRSPLRGIEQATLRLGQIPREVTVGTRTGDTPAAERRRFATTPPDILITTPESLFLMLTSAARSGLAGVETVIIDEIHYVAGTKRGAHLALSLERLDALLDSPARRIGLSATVEPVTAVAQFLAGERLPSQGGRPVTVVKPAIDKEFDISVVVPVEDMNDLSNNPNASDLPFSADAAQASRPPSSSMWPHVEEKIVDLVQDHSSTLIFTNARRGAERLTAHMNEIWAQRQGLEVLPPGERHAAQIQAQSGASAGVEPVIARAHHGSMSRAERTRTETDLKNGVLPAVVSTSSLELGIDMGAIDLVVQVGPPPSVSSGLQRVGRAGHQVGAISHGKIFPLHRGELPSTAVIAQRMREGKIEPYHRVSNPLDVLAQQIVAMLAVDDWTLDELSQLVRRASPFAGLGDASLTAVLDMLSGRYPSEDFGELRARIVWDRVTNTLSSRPGALRLATTSGGTIPDRGLYGVFLVDSASPTNFATDSAQDAAAIDPRVAPSAKNVRLKGGKRVGELDEEMVYESRVGDVFTLGSSSWRIEEITPDRVLVSPAPGLPGRLPFWKGDSLGRPVELGKAIGRWIRTTVNSRHSDPTWLGLEPNARANLSAYLDEQVAATGTLPSDTTIVVEKFRDELGDWRVVIHSPLGARVHAPWALVIADRIRERYGIDASVMHADDGIVLRIPNLDESLDFSDPFKDPFTLDLIGDHSEIDSTNAELRQNSSPQRRDVVSADDLLLDPDDVMAAVRERVSDSTLFGARFREAAARALLLPRARPDKRQPLWQQRQRSAQLLSVASNFPDFPIVLEAVRECLQDDFDVPALVELMRAIKEGAIRIVEVTTSTPSPFAQTLLFGYTAQFVYDGDAPLAERRAAALTLDPTLLAELLGAQGSDLADLLDPQAVRDSIDELEHRSPERAIRTAEYLWEFLSRWGPATLEDIATRIHSQDNQFESAPHPDSEDPVAEASNTAQVTALRFVEHLEAARRIIRVRLAGLPPSEAWQWAAIEDAGRLRDALGVALPVGVPEDFTQLVPDPLGDLVRRHARTHGPFTAQHIARRFGLGIAVVNDVLRRLVARGLLVQGRLMPRELTIQDPNSPFENGAGYTEQYCDADVMRMLRRRSLAALRAEVEPVSPSALGQFLTHWQHIGSLHGMDGLYQAIEQLTGIPLPVSALESQILPLRVSGYRTAMLDELIASGQVVWFGHRLTSGPRGGRDAIVSLHLADGAELTLPSVEKLSDHEELGSSQEHASVFELLAQHGAFFSSQIAATLGLSEARVETILWDLVWAGYITNDNFTPLRALLGSTGSAPTSRAPARPRMSRSRFGSIRPHSVTQPQRPLTAGRWSALSERDTDPTRRLHASATVLLDRYGVVTRSIATIEELEEPFAQVYRVLSTAESLGKIRRGYFIEHLGGSQFARDGAVDLLRSIDSQLASAAQHRRFNAVVLAAMDPANPYGSFLDWPQAPDTTNTHRPGRKTGSSVVLVNGELVMFVEKGGKSLLTFTSDLERLTCAAHALVAAVDAGSVSKIRIAKINGGDALSLVRATAGTEPLEALRSAGFTVTPSGVRYQPSPVKRYAGSTQGNTVDSWSSQGGGDGA